MDKDMESILDHPLANRAVLAADYASVAGMVGILCCSGDGVVLFCTL